jgi:type IV secretion system protein TrbB
MSPSPPAPASPRDVQRERLLTSLRYELADLQAPLEDPDIQELLLNPDGSVWAQSATRGFLELQDLRFDPIPAESLIATVAALVEREVTPENPILEAVLPPHSFRFTGVLPPVAEAPVLSIRKPPPSAFYLEKDYVESGRMTPADAEVLRQALRNRENILISGGTGSGKTALLAALLRELGELIPNVRLAVLEDTPEIRLMARNSFRLLTTPSVSLRLLVRTVLRLRPDSIVIGELRGPEAHDLLKAWNTGHPGGLTTLHANSATAALLRLDQLAQEANVPSQAALIAETVHLVAHLAGRGSELRLGQLVRPTGLHAPLHRILSRSNM